LISIAVLLEEDGLVLVGCSLLGDGRVLYLPLFWINGNFSNAELEPANCFAVLLKKFAISQKKKTINFLLWFIVFNKSLNLLII